MRYIIPIMLLLSSNSAFSQGTKKSIIDYMDMRIHTSYPLLLKSEVKGIAQIGLGPGLYLTKTRKFGSVADIEFGLYQLQNHKILIHQNVYLGLKYNLYFNASMCFSPYIQVGYSYFSVSKNKSKGVGLSAGFEIYRSAIGFRFGYKRLFNNSLNYEGIIYPMGLNVLEFGLVYRFN